jgi:hypothetical protein
MTYMTDGTEGPRLKKCPFCAEEIQDAAIVCKHCGRDLVSGQSSRVLVPQAAQPSSGVAAVLSLVIPGAGQMYKGHVGSGLVWLIAVVVGYAMLIVPGLILHLLCILSAASSRPTASRAAPTGAAGSPEPQRQPTTVEQRMHTVRGLQRFLLVIAGIIVMAGLLALMTH